MHKIPNFQYFYKNDSDTLDIILHGFNEGMESRFMQKIVTKAKSYNHSVAAFNFPYFDRNDDHSSGNELREEKDALRSLIEYLNQADFKKINLIGKSLGAIVASYYLRDLSQDDQQQYTITVLGYAVGDIDLKSFIGKITIIQGDLDKYGDINKAKEDIKEAQSKDITYIAIPNADHSYRNTETKEPMYEDEAISKISL